MPPNTRQTPPRTRGSTVEAAAVRRLAARRAVRAEKAASAPVQEAPVRETETARRRGLPFARTRVDARARRTLPFGKMFLPSLLAVVTLALGGLAAWFGAEAAALNGAPSAQNRALADPVETSQVSAQATSALNALFSYNYASPGKTQRAASRLLTGAAVRQYASLFGQVQQGAVKNKRIVTMSVTQVGVELLTSGTARALVFATETDQQAGSGTPTPNGAMLAVNMTRVGTVWKISGIDTFSG